MPAQARWWICPEARSTRPPEREPHRFAVRVDTRIQIADARLFAVPWAGPLGHSVSTLLRGNKSTPVEIALQDETSMSVCLATALRAPIYCRPALPTRAR